MWCLKCGVYCSSPSTTQSDAQLSQPGEPVCVGNQVVLSCEHTDSAARWTVTLLSGIELEKLVRSTDAGRILTFENDPGFGFELHVLSRSSAIRVFSELRVTAASQLNGVSVECTGPSGIFMSTIHVTLVGKPSCCTCSMLCNPLLSICIQQLATLVFLCFHIKPHKLPQVL